MRFLCILVILFSNILYSQNYPSLDALNEFHYGDHISILDSLKYPLLKTGIDESGDSYKAFLINQATGTYIIFRSTKFRKEYVYGIQITGSDSTTQLIENLHLGDLKDKVFKILGSPTDSSFVASVSTTHYTFKDRNYSIEIDKDNKLFSFALLGDDGLLEKNEWPSNWLEYQPSSIEIETINLLEPSDDQSETVILLLANPQRFRPRVKYLGRSRPISSESKGMLEYWAKSNSQRDFIKYFTIEIEVSENSQTYWIPFQESLLPDLNKYSNHGEKPLELFALGIGMKGGNMMILVNEFVIW